MNKLPTRLLLCMLLLVAAPVRAGLFDDDEARKRIEQVRSEMDERMQKLEEASRAQLALSNQLEALRSELARLRGQLEVTTNDVDQSQKRQKDFYLDLDTRLRKVEAAISDMNQKIASNSAALTVRPQPSELALDPAQEPKDYETALNALRGGKHVEAVVAFKQFIKTWPKSTYLPSAHYWAGTASMQARDFDSASDYYSKLVSAWPDDTLAPDAMLGLASAQQELGDAKTARKTLETLVSKYPKSEAAKTAKQRLARK